MIIKPVARGTFNIDVYSVKVNVIITANGLDASKKIQELAKKYNRQVDAPRQVYGYTVCFTDFENEYFLIYAADTISMNYLTHETYHLTEFIEQFNSLVQDENKEATANLNGYINQRVTDIFKKNQIEIH